MLNEKQQLFFESIESGRNVFVSGPAGVGKSFCIKRLTQDLIGKNAPFGITAATGIAALSIGGSTLHSWCGVGLASESADYLAMRIKKMAPIRTKILKTKILIVDEISMLSGEFLDKIDFIFKKIKNNRKSFGGIQMIFSGDALQLPPVSKDRTAKLFFESESWKNASVNLVQLTEQVRQKNDNEFSEILNEIRVGNGGAALKLVGNDVVFPDDGIKPVVLFCLNRHVENHNESEMAKLPGIGKKYYSNRKGDKKDCESLSNSCPAPDILNLKVGAQVILLKNLDTEGGLVNGSQGVVLALGAESVTVKFKNGAQEVSRANWELKKQSIGGDGGTKFKVAATINQIPLKLAYSLSVHRSQGLTLDRVIFDATGSFENGLIYTALSRVRDRKSLIIKNLDINKITAHPKALEFYGYKPLESENDDPFDF